jgi:hypothetical protein
VAKIEVTAFTGGSPDGFAIELDFPKVGRRFSAHACLMRRVAALTELRKQSDWASSESRILKRILTLMLGGFVGGICYRWPMDILTGRTGAVS